MARVALPMETLAVTTGAAVRMTNVGADGRPVAFSSAFISASGAGGVRWRDDGEAPTATVGHLLADAASMNYTGDFRNLRFISVSGNVNLFISKYASAVA